MTLYDTFPDAEAVVTTRLRAELTVPVFTELPHDAEATVVTVRRIGGLPAVRQRLDAAEIQVDVWGITKAEAHDVAQAARVALMETGNTVVSYDGGSAAVTGVDDSSGMAWLPDPTSKRERYTFTVRLYLHSA